MSKHMERDLDNLQKATLIMAAAVEEAVHTATRALMAGDTERARLCIAGDAAIDQFENQVQEECLKILALHQPVAGDLRRVAAVLLISTDLERMGDLAVAIAERALALRQPGGPAVPESLTHMADRTAAMVRRSLDAFVQHDAELARAVIRDDVRVDAEAEAIAQGLVTTMKTHADAIDAALSLFSVVRHLERIADHATNIAEDVVYVIEGEQLRHTPAGRDGSRVSEHRA